MNIVLGFGSTETAFEENEQKFVQEFVDSKKKCEDGWCSFPDEMVDELKAVLKSRQNEYHRLRDEYKSAESYPDRYSSYYVTVLHDLHNIVTIFDFSHINRKHPLSNDGWGMLGSTQVYLFKSNP